MLDVIFGGLVRVTARELRVTVGDERLVRRVGMIAFLIMLGCGAVMVCGRFMMVGRGNMMLRARENFRHGVSNAVLGWQVANVRYAKRREIGAILYSEYKRGGPILRGNNSEYLRVRDFYSVDTEKREPFEIMEGSVLLR